MIYYYRDGCWAGRGNSHSTPLNFPAISETRAQVEKLNAGERDDDVKIIQCLTRGRRVAGKEKFGFRCQDSNSSFVIMTQDTLING